MSEGTKLKGRQPANRATGEGGPVLKAFREGQDLVEAEGAQRIQTDAGAHRTEARGLAGNGPL